MLATNVGVATFEIPENAVRVLLTGYGVSLACISITQSLYHLLRIHHTHYRSKVSPPHDTP